MQRARVHIARVSSPEEKIQEKKTFQEKLSYVGGGGGGRASSKLIHDAAEASFVDLTAPLWS